MPCTLESVEKGFGEDALIHTVFTVGRRLGHTLGQLGANILWKRAVWGCAASKVGSMLKHKRERLDNADQVG